MQIAEFYAALKPTHTSSTYNTTYARKSVLKVFAWPRPKRNETNPEHPQMMLIANIFCQILIKILNITLKAVL